MAVYTAKNHFGDRYVQKTLEGILVWDFWAANSELTFEEEGEVDALVAREPEAFEEIT